MHPPTNGHYEGLVSRLGAVTLEVSGDLAQDSNGLSLKVKAKDGSSSWAIKLTRNGSSAKLEIQPAEFPPQQLSPDQDRCLTSARGAPLQVRLCYEDSAFVVSASQGGPGFKLDLQRFDPASVPPMEQPSSLTFDEILARAKARNFQSRIEFEKVAEAKDAARNAWLNLIPHLNTGDALTLATQNWLNIFKTVGDLAPFLLPSRWFKAEGASDQLRAETEAWRIMDVDGMSVAEGLAYASLRDANVLAVLSEEHDLIASIRTDVQTLERGNTLQQGASDDVTSVLDTIEKARLNLKDVQADELAALARAAGFFNPHAISAIGGELPASVSDPVNLDPDTINAWALSRSAELKQADDLIAYARTAAHARFFAWIDPSGDPSGGLGAGLPSYIQAGRDQIAEMQAQRANQQSLILTKAASLLNDIGALRDAYALSQRDLDVQNRRLARVRNNIRIGVSFTMVELTTLLQDHVRAELDSINAQFGYVAALGALNRLTWTGPYSDLLIEHPTP